MGGEQQVQGSLRRVGREGGREGGREKGEGSYLK